MEEAKLKSLIKRAYREGNGIFRLAPTWVPMAFCIPGRRLKLATEDLYFLGVDRGGIDGGWPCAELQFYC